MSCPSPSASVSFRFSPAEFDPNFVSLGLQVLISISLFYPLYCQPLVMNFSVLLSNPPHHNCWIWSFSPFPFSCSTWIIFLIFPIFHCRMFCSTSAETFGIWVLWTQIGAGNHQIQTGAKRVGMAQSCWIFPPRIWDISTLQNSMFPQQNQKFGAPRDKNETNFKTNEELLVCSEWNEFADYKPG